MRHDRDACTAIAHKIREREPPAGMGNSKELIPVLVRRILGFNKKVLRKPYRKLFEE